MAPAAIPNTETSTIGRWWALGDAALALPCGVFVAVDEAELDDDDDEAIGRAEVERTTLGDGDAVDEGGATTAEVDVGGAATGESEVEGAGGAAGVVLGAAAAPPPPAAAPPSANDFVPPATSP